MAGPELKREAVWRRLRDDIMTGVRRPGERLPTEQALAELLGVGKNTVRAALKVLEDQGLIRRCRAKGTFVCEEITTADTPCLLVVEPSNRAGGLYPYMGELARRHGREAGFSVKQILDYEVLAHDGGSLRTWCDTSNIHAILLLQTGFRDGTALPDRLKEAGRPLVLATTTAEDAFLTGLPGSIADQRKIWRLAIEHLAALGHRHVGIVTSEGYLREFTEAQHLEVIREYGFDMRPDLLADIGPVDQDAGERVTGAVSRWLQRIPEMTAILAMCDPISSLVYRSLARLGLSIPGDLAVMSGGGLEWERRDLTPTLTSVTVDHDAQVAAAVRLLKNSKAWFGQTDVAPPRLHFEPSLVQGQSTAARRVETACKAMPAT